jgi:hypothetical protein
MPDKFKALSIVILLATVLAACAGGTQPIKTETPVEPTILPKPGSTATPYPVPGEPGPYPPAVAPYPPADQAVISPPYPGPQQPYPAPWQPQTADQNLQRGEAFVKYSDILVMESFPPQFLLNIQGSLPTPCHQLRVDVAPPDDQMQIQVSVYSIVDPNAICIQVLAPYDVNVPLEGLSTGQYTVIVNGDKVGSIDVP